MKNYRGYHTARRLVLALLAAVPLVLAACGSTSGTTSGSAAAGTSSSAGTSAATSAGAPSATYTGRDSQLPNTYPVPTVKPGTHFRVGYLQIYGAVDVLRDEQDGAAAAVKQLGGQIIVKDAGLSLQNQVAQFDQLLAQNVNAIVVYPVVPQTLVPELQKAKAAGIPVISTNARPDVSKPLTPGYTSDVEQAIDFEAWSLARAMSHANPGGRVAVIGLAVPVQALTFLSARELYYAKQDGMKVLGEVQAQQDTPAGYGAAMTALLAKYPNVQSVLTYSDIVALSAQAVAQSQGKTHLLIAGAAGGTTAMHQAIKAGKIAMTYQIPWLQTGAQMVRGAYLEVTHQHLPLPPTITLKGEIITKQNVDQVPSVN